MRAVIPKGRLGATIPKDLPRAIISKGRLGAIIPKGLPRATISVGCKRIGRLQGDDAPCCSAPCRGAPSVAPLLERGTRACWH